MSTTDAVPGDPWREELTPRSRASRRRWTVVLAALLVLVGLSATSDDLRDVVFRDGTGGRGFLVVVLLLVVFGLLRRGTRRLGALRDHDARLDERDLAARHRAFRTAFGLFLLVVALTIYALPAAVPDAERTIDDATVSGSFLDEDALFALIAWLLVWAVFLPTAALAWREPDAPALDAEDGDVRPVLGEARRDLLLLAVFVVGGAASATYPDNNAAPETLVGLLPFALLVIAVGVLRGRREGHSWVRSTLGVWRIATGVAMVVALLVLVGGGFAAGGGDDVDAVDAGPGAHETSFLRVGDDGRERRVRCVQINDPAGRPLSGREARREARLLGEDPRRVCD
jgi:hypothetical protein